MVAKTHWETEPITNLESAIKHNMNESDWKHWGSNSYSIN